MIKMVFAFVFIFNLFVYVNCYAQNYEYGEMRNSKKTTKYFVNNIEIAPQSVQFLRVADIDSIKTIFNPTHDTDTAVVLYTKKADSLLTFDMVMDDYFVVPEARHFIVNTPNYKHVEEPFKLIFSENSVGNVHVYRSDGEKPGYINISLEEMDNRGNEKVRAEMFRLIIKFNNLPKP